LNEKALHAALKELYAQPGDRSEVPVDGFVIDLVRGSLLIEIQTGNFASIKSKLTTLVRSHSVRLVYPIVQEKWIVRFTDDDRRESARRKSPVRGRLEDLFRVMVSIPHLITNPNFTLEVLLIREEEIRRFDPNGPRRRKGWAVTERRLLEVVHRHALKEAADWRGFIPAELECFTTSDLAAALSARLDLAQKMAYCLRGGKVIELVEKHGRANLYRVAGA
jgi:hypothetical protein